MTYTVSIKFKDDGSFYQAIEEDSGSGIHHTLGTWTLNGSRILLKGLFVDEWIQARGRSEWTKKDADWWFVDWHDSSQQVALYGGLHPNPDSFAPWTKKR